MLRQLQDEKFIQTLQVRSKPDQTIERLIAKIKTPLALRDKQRNTISNLHAKNEELDREITESKKQIEHMENQVRDITASLSKEMSDKVKTRCLIVQQ